MSAALAYLAGTLLLVGAVFGLLAAIGIVRMPDLYTRMHAATKAGTIGGGAVFLAVAAGFADGAVLARALIGIIFLTLTTPVSAHLLARAAHLSGYRTESINEMDELQNNTKP
jgi:multicomponent Na+:H+ antiporter subunit G